MKKIIKTLLVVMVLAVVLTAFTGCDAVETIKNIVPDSIAAMIPPHVTCSVFGHKGEAYSPCERCGEVWTESLQGSLECNSVGHDMKAFEEVAATCTEDGLSAGVVCTRCGYAERNRFVIPAKGHKMADPTCEDPSTCTVCGHTEGEALGHTSVDVEALAPTCSAKGYTAGTACDVCGDILSGCEEIDIDPTAHGTPVDVEALAPTCSTAGHTAGTICGLCEEILSGCEEIAIDPDAHYFVSGLCGICQKVFEHGVGDNTRVALETLGVANDGSLYEFIYFYIPEAGHYKLTGENVVLSVFKLTDAGVDWASGVFTEGVFEAGVYVLGLNYYAGAGEYSFNISISHNFEKGLCGCGAVDPEYSKDYYLVGYLNGSDYTGNDYKFVDGKLTVTFNQDSYVYLKLRDTDEEDLAWYMTSAYVPGKTATLVDTTTGSAEKMYVPGNKEVTFTLTENEDGTLTLVADYTYTYTVAGGETAVFGKAWDPTNTANDMIYDEETGLWSISYINTTSSTIWAHYKVCRDYGWATNWGASAAGQSGDNAWVEFPANKMLTIYFDAENGKITTKVGAYVETDIALTVDSLGLKSSSYSASTATVGGVGFEWIQLGNYGDGIQVRDKNGNTSSLWNTTAFSAPIARIELVASSTKSVYSNSNCAIYSFGNGVDDYTCTVKLSTVAGVTTYTITPDSLRYTYFKFEHDLGYTQYWESITIVLVDGTVITQ